MTEVTQQTRTDHTAVATLDRYPDDVTYSCVPSSPARPWPPITVPEVSVEGLGEERDKSWGVPA